jgi:hypothetical protein
MSPALERCNSPHDLLHEVVRAGLPRLVRGLAEVDRVLPRFVQRELEHFVACGDPRHGFAWLHCAPPCDQHRLVPFSCKGRGFCPSCGGRRMASTAARLCDEVFRRVAVRQWVVTVPWGRRWLLARKPELLAGVRRIAMSEVFGFYEGQVAARVLPSRGGAVVATQRFGSALNLNVHLHALLADGVYQKHRDGVIRFRRGGAPTTEEVEEVAVRIAERVEAWLSSQGYCAEDEAGADVEPDDGQALLLAASLEGRAAVGDRAGRRVRAQRFEVLGGRVHRLPRQCAMSEGYTVHAGVVVGAQNQAGKERLCRYVLRPPLAKERLERRPDGLLDLSFKRAWSDGTAGIVLTDEELVQRLAALVPPPRKHQVVALGVYANRSPWRSQVVARKRRQSMVPRLSRKERKSLDSAWVPWAELLHRVFGVDAFACPKCGGQMRLRAVVLGPVTAKILAGLQRSARGPPVEAAV